MSSARHNPLKPDPSKPDSPQSGSVPTAAPKSSSGRKAALVVAVAVWLALVFAWMYRGLDSTVRLDKIGLAGRYIKSEPVYDAGFGLAAFCGLLLVVAGRRRTGIARYGRYSFAFPLLWHASVYFADRFYFPFVRVKLVDFGLAALFMIGLGWLVFYVERRWREHVFYTHGREADDSPESRPRIWDPFHPRAWYYGRHNAKLHQSLAILANYSLLFFAACLLSSQLSGCEEINELPAGGGKPQLKAQRVNVQKKIVKKLIFNPFSSILMSTPPLDDPKMDMRKLTSHQYAVGAGEGDGAGLGGDSPSGKMRFIRLQYSGGDWDQDMNLFPDLMLLVQYQVRTQHKVAEQPEVFPISRLDNFKLGAAPPLVYMTGSKSINLSKGEVQTLRKYLLDNHGTLFLDHGGGSFGQQAEAMMRQIAPQIEPVIVPRDDPFHEGLSIVPIVSPHGGREAKGWRHEGRWIAYMHPGDIGDAWAEDHAGVSAETADACYHLGVNIMLQTGSEYGKWQRARGFK